MVDVVFKLEVLDRALAGAIILENVDIGTCEVMMPGSMVIALLADRKTTDIVIITPINKTIKTDATNNAFLLEILMSEF